MNDEYLALQRGITHGGDGTYDKAKGTSWIDRINPFYSAPKQSPALTPEITKDYTGRLDELQKQIAEFSQPEHDKLVAQLNKAKEDQLLERQNKADQNRQIPGLAGPRLVMQDGSLAPNLAPERNTPQSPSQPNWGSKPPPKFGAPPSSSMDRDGNVWFSNGQGGWSPQPGL